MGKINYFSRQQQIVIFTFILILLGVGLTTYFVKHGDAEKSAFSEQLVEIEPVPLNKRPINVNTADLEELTLLPGIGEKIASEIICQREKTPFKNISQLNQVKGIGEKKLKEIEEYIRFE